eukprot:UN19835
MFVYQFHGLQNSAGFRLLHREARLELKRNQNCLCERKGVYLAKFPPFNLLQFSLGGKSAFDWHSKQPND